MFASLSSGLLARKGAAKPAMRPQGFGQMGSSLEDLGWNDMGHEARGHAGREPAPAPASDLPDEDSATRRSLAAGLSPAAGHAAPVHGQTAEPRTHMDAEPELEAPVLAIVQPVPEPVREPAPVSMLPVRPVEAPVAPQPRREPGANGRSAFTLRLDPARHLRLRLACAVDGRSAQGLVTEALDQYLRSIPELEQMAGQVPAGTKTSSRKG